MGNVQFTIDNQSLTAAKDSTILDAAASVGIRIPTLCLLKGRNPAVNCRMCVVEVEGSRAFRLACATKVSEGMVIHTDSPAVRQSRKDSLELLLSHHSVDCHHCLRLGLSKCDDLDPTFCEMCFFCDCVRDGFCELQELAREYKVDALPHKIEAELYPVDTSTGCIVRNPNKCIQCRRCEDVCSNIQTVHALAIVGHGTDKKVMPSQGESLAETPCVLCGRCVEVCPTGAIHELEQKDELLYHTHNYDATTVAQVSADVLDELAILFKLKRSEVDIRHVVAGLKKIGVDYVVTEEVPLTHGQAMAAQYLTENATKDKRSTIITNSYAATQFVKRYFPALSDNMFYYDSAQQQFGKLVKGNWLSSIKSDPSKKIVTISVTSNNDNEGEATKNGSVDYVLNARELYRIFLRTGVNLQKIHPVEPDSFGVAAELPSTVAQLLAPVTWEIGSSIDELDVVVGDVTVKAAVGKTLGHARQLLEQLSNQASPYHIIKISS
jgi:formate hydrogenlyase subunit 6/NADH:ubiquinone oxidoreductase subunit I